jgi:hypothetical protein
VPLTDLFFSIRTLIHEFRQMKHVGAASTPYAKRNHAFGKRPSGYAGNPRWLFATAVAFTESSIATRTVNPAESDGCVGGHPVSSVGIESPINWLLVTNVSSAKSQMYPLLTSGNMKPNRPPRPGAFFLPTALPRGRRRPTPYRRKNHRERNPVVRKVLKPASTTDWRTQESRC